MIEQEPRMTFRTSLAAILSITLVSLSAGTSLADGRTEAARVEPARAGRMEKASPAPAPARGKQAKLEPKQSDAARRSGSANMRTARARR
jgi:hypothetical protein